MQLIDIYAAHLLERLKTYNRPSRDLKLLSFGQYEHLAGRLEELGPLPGGCRTLTSVQENREEPLSTACYVGILFGVHFSMGRR